MPRRQLASGDAGRRLVQPGVRLRLGGLLERCLHETRTETVVKLVPRHVIRQEAVQDRGILVGEGVEEASDGARREEAAPKSIE